MTPQERLARRCRRLLRCYPRAWRDRRQDEVLAVLLDQAEAGGRSSLGLVGALDLVGHGLEARLDAAVRRLPERFRRRTACVALVAAAGLALILLGGELVAATLSAEVVLDAALLAALVLVVVGRSGFARLLTVLGTVVAAAMACVSGLGVVPVPRLPLLAVLGGLSLLASLTRLRADRSAGVRLVRAEVGFVLATSVGLLLSRVPLGWSVATMTTSGNVALAALALALPIVTGAAMLVAFLVRRPHPGWLAALAVAAVPVVVCCAATSVAVNPTEAATRGWIPAAYVTVLVVVALVVRRRRLRSAAR